MWNSKSKPLPLIVFVLVIGLVWLKSKHPEDFSFLNGSKSRVDDELSNSRHAQESAAQGRPWGGTPDVTGSAHLVEPNAKTPGQNRFQESLAKRQEFLQRSFLALNLPPNLYYSSVDLDDKAIAIYGNAKGAPMKVTAIASHKTGTPAQAFQYFQGIADGIPNLRGQTIDHWDPAPRTVPLPKDSGLSNVTLWKATLQSGEVLFVAFVAREDGKGAYMTVASGSAQYFARNDGVFENLLRGLHAVPAK